MFHFSVCFTHHKTLKLVITNHFGNGQPNFILIGHFVLAILNQARIGRRPARAWFLEIALVYMLVCVCLSVCLLLRVLIMDSVNST